MDTKNQVENQTLVAQAVAQAENNISDYVEVSQARLVLRGDGAKQNQYNLMLLDTASIDHLDAHAAKFGHQPQNEQGEHYVTVTLDDRSVMELRRGGRGHKKLLVSGLLILQGATNGKPTGAFEVARGSVSVVTFQNGGRVIERPTNNRQPVSSGRSVGLSSFTR